MTRGVKEFQTLQRQVHALAIRNGWWDEYRFGDGFGAIKPNDLGARLALVHSEVSEALECVRDGEMAVSFRDDGKPEGFPTELADIVIRCMDLASAMGIDLWAEMERKHFYNCSRPRRHGGKVL